jgi:hypothetical protein
MMNKQAAFGIVLDDERRSLAVWTGLIGQAARPFPRLTILPDPSDQQAAVRLFRPAPLINSGLTRTPLVATTGMRIAAAGKRGPVNPYVNVLFRFDAMLLQESGAKRTVD